MHSEQQIKLSRKQFLFLQIEEIYVEHQIVKKNNYCIIIIVRNCSQSGGGAWPGGKWQHEQRAFMEGCQ